MAEQLLPTTVVGSYPQPEWLVDFSVLKAQTVPRVRVKEMWRVPEPYLEHALDGIDIDTPAVVKNRAGVDTVMPRVVGKVQRRGAVELRDMQFLRRNTER